MKKLLVAVLAIFCVSTASAQEFNLGARFGAGFQVVGQYGLSSSNYIEGRLGTTWAEADGYSPFDITATYNWKIETMNWTPSVGKWFFDAGVGVNAWAHKQVSSFAIAGVARLGLKFNDVPVSLALDWTPGFNFKYGFKGANICLTAVYHF